MSRKSLIWVIMACLLVANIGVSGASNNFPSKPISLIVPFAAGGGTDAVARALAKSAESFLGQPVTIVNVTGAGGAMGMTQGLHAAPDGYTILMGAVEITMHPLMGNVQWKPSDFTPIIGVNSDAAAVTVRADSPYKTLEEFIAAAKKNPGKLMVGGSGSGAIWHMACLELQRKTKTKLTFIPFPGGATPAITDLLGGHLDAVSVSAAEVSQYVQAGKLRILAVMAPKRLKAFPDVPTTEEKGYATDISTWRALVAPTKTPSKIVKVLHDKFKAAMEDPKFISFMEKGGYGIGYMSSNELGKFMNEQGKTFKPLLKEVNLLKEK